MAVMSESQSDCTVADGVAPWARRRAGQQGQRRRPQEAKAKGHAEGRMGRLEKHPAPPRLSTDSPLPGGDRAARGGLALNPEGRLAGSWLPPTMSPSRVTPAPPPRPRPRPWPARSAAPSRAGGALRQGRGTMCHVVAVRQYTPLIEKNGKVVEPRTRLYMLKRCRSSSALRFRARPPGGRPARRGLPASPSRAITSDSTPSWNPPTAWRTPSSSSN